MASLTDEEMLEFLEENSEKVGSLINFLPKKNLKLLTLQEFFSLKSDWIELDDGKIKTKSKIAYSKKDEAFYKKVTNQWYYIQFPEMPQLDDEKFRKMLTELYKIEKKTILIEDQLSDFLASIKDYLDLKIEEMKTWTEKQLNQ